jgi:hypothetical protein
MIDTRPMKSATNRKLHKLLTAADMMDDKGLLVHSHTEGRTTHSSEMQEWEAQGLIMHLQRTQLVEEEKCQHMRRKILAICHTLGWYGRNLDQTLIVHNGKPVLDFVRINKFCEERGNAHKPLQKHTSKELTVLVTIFEKLSKSDLQ